VTNGTLIGFLEIIKIQSSRKYTVTSQLNLYGYTINYYCQTYLRNKGTPTIIEGFIEEK